ncbi:uncharacterized protein LOC117117705 [Anneissia japonica]|uniref:uncharacterized protein LOC117117705 n=1 Tax=Anneissia japonica TaxID=1529436 RepID=UPI00142558F8|nr:uncharacterized protein LOC117117705 [Anneissia japonica]
MSCSTEFNRIKAGMFSLPLSINQQFFDRDHANTAIRQHETYLKENKDRPHRFAIRNFLAVFHFRLGNIFKACEYLKGTIKEDESNINAISDLAYVYQKLYKHTEAETLLAKLKCLTELQKNVDNSERELLKSRCIAEAGYMYANDLNKGTVSTEKHNLARNKYTEAIRLSVGIVGEKELQDWKFYRGLLSRSIYNIHLDFDAGIHKNVKELYDEARDDLKSNLTADSIHRQADANSLIGDLMAKRCSRGMCPRDKKENGKFKKCQCRKNVNDFYKTALRIDPKNIRTYVRYGRELAHSRDFENALLRFNQAIVLDPSSTNWFAYSSRAGVYITKYNQRKDIGYLLLAEADLLKSIMGNPSPIDFGRLGHVYHMLGSNPANKSSAIADGEGGQNDVDGGKQYLLKALHYFMNATEIKDGNLRSDIHFKRGKCLLDMNEQRGAIESFKKALECEQTNCKTLKNIGSLILSLFDMYKMAERENGKEILAELCFWWRQGFQNKPVDDFVNNKKNVDRMVELMKALLENQESDQETFVIKSLKVILNENKHKKESVNKLWSQYTQDEGLNGNSATVSGDLTPEKKASQNDGCRFFLQHNGRGSAQGGQSFSNDTTSAATTTAADIAPDATTIAVQAGFDGDVATTTSVTNTGAIVPVSYDYNNSIKAAAGTRLTDISTTTPCKKSLKRSESRTLLTIGRGGICISPFEEHPSKYELSTELKRCTIADVVLYICEQLDVYDSEGPRSTMPHSPSTSKSGFDYDFFVVFSKKQKEWVYYTLLARLEQTYRFKGCIPDRDFTPGVTVCQNIENSVKTSACTLVVIDKEFCQDHELRHRLTYAYYTNARLKKLLIPILKEHPCEVPMEICNITPLIATSTINLSKLARDIEIASLEDRHAVDICNK